MRKALLLLLTLVACGGDDGTGPQTPRADYFVNEVAGNDANTGTTANAAFRTITKALSVADSGDTIQVAPGLYDAAIGEVFPLVVPEWVALIGDEADKGGGSAPTVIAGGDTVQLGPPITAAINPASNSIVAGFTIIDSASALANPVAVYVVSTAVTIRNNRVLNSLAGIHVRTGGSDLVIVGNIISGNAGGAGIDLIGAGAGTRVEGNTITGNLWGVAWSSPGVYVDLGGGTASSAGGNILSCNASNDIWVNTTITFDAQDNRWDHVPPGMGASAGGLDIYNGGAQATIDTTGATLAPSPCT
jgi:hypothetical protein